MKYQFQFDITKLTPILCIHLITSGPWIMMDGKPVFHSITTIDISRFRGRFASILPCPDLSFELQGIYINLRPVWGWAP